MLLSILLIGISLSMDAFAVSVTNGLTLKNFSVRHALWMGLYFGGFQFLMPLLGCLLGSTVSHYIMKFGPYISFALLAFIGGKMLLEGVRPAKEGEEDEGGMTVLSIKAFWPPPWRPASTRWPSASASPFRRTSGSYRAAC